MQAIKAMIVEAVFATAADGLIGAISQQLRKARPLWATIAVLWFAMPAGMVVAQLIVHRVVHTPHLTGGVTVSFCLTAIASAFSWFAMRRGAMLGGTDETTVKHDLQALPGIVVDFFVTIWRRATRAQRGA